MTVDRRHFLKGAAAGAATTAAVGGLTWAGARADAGDTESVLPQTYPLLGAHQSGILTPPPAQKQAYAGFVAFDLITPNRTAVADVLRTLTERARVLTAGGALPDLGVGQPPADSDILGPDMPADGLTVTVGFGSTFFDRLGLAGKRPRHLTPMRIFPNDAPEDAWMHGDISLQVCAHQPDVIHHAIRDITRHTRGAIQPRWKIEGYGAPPRPSGSARNLLGFKDGTANPTGAAASDLIWIDDASEPAWAQGGTYQVIRVIRMLVEFWDRVSIREQEKMFGRRRDSGAPLDGNAEFDTPNYAADPKGQVVPLDSHMRLANPRTSTTENQRLLRRSYNYDLGLDLNGNMSAGHVFVCYQQDVQRQFEKVQERLINEPLVDYVQPFGGGYFFVPPGLSGSTDWYGRSLLG